MKPTFTWILAAACVATALLAAAPVRACDPESFVDSHGDGVLRGRDGKWRRVWLELHQQWLRFEFETPKGPTGRLAVLGEIVDGRAWLFPVRYAGHNIPRNAQVTWRTSIREAFAEFGMPTEAVEFVEHYRWGDADKADETVNGIACRYPDAYRSVGTGGQTRLTERACLHRTGMPVALKNAYGERVFELKHISLGATPRRFLRPPFRVTDKRPKYLGGFTCGGGAAAPPP